MAAMAGGASWGPSRGFRCSCLSLLRVLGGAAEQNAAAVLNVLSLMSECGALAHSDCCDQLGVN